MTTEMKRIVVYLTDDEVEKVQDKATEKELTLSAYVRARLGFKAKPRGAPEGNLNALGKRKKRKLRKK